MVDMIATAEQFNAIPRSRFMNCRCRRLVLRETAFYTMNRGNGGLQCLACADESTYRLFDFGRPLRYVMALPLFGVRSKYLESVAQKIGPEV